MPRKRRRRSAPTYLTTRDGRIYYRYRMVVTHRGYRVVRNVNSLSDHPHDWQASLEAVQGHRQRVRAKLVEAIEGHATRATRPATIRELADEWLADCEEREVRTDVERYRLEVLCDSLGGDAEPDRMTADHVLRWRRELRRARSLSPASANAYTALLKMILNHGIRRGRIKRSPAEHVTPLPVQRPDPETLTVEQMAALLEALADFERYQERERQQRKVRPMGTGTPSAVPLRGIVLTAYYTLARTRNVLELRWEQVDLEHRLIRFPETKNTRRAGVRVVAPMREPLHRYLVTARPVDAGGWVFPSPAGRPYRDVRKAWRRLLGMANDRLAQAAAELGVAPNLIPPGFRLYNLRHTGASHLAASGAMSAAEIAELMGDTRVETVERRYFRLDVERIRRGLERAATDEELAEVDRRAIDTPASTQAVN